MLWKQKLYIGDSALYTQTPHCMLAPERVRHMATDEDTLQEVSSIADVVRARHTDTVCARV